MKKTAKSIFLFIVSAMLIVGGVFSVSAAQGTLLADSPTAQIGGSFTLNVSLNNNPGVIALSASVEYDSKVLELTGVQNGAIFEDIYITSQKLTVNPYKVIWMDATAPENITKNGTLLKLNFRVLSTASVGSTAVKVTVDDSTRVDHTKADFAACTASVKLVQSGTATASDSQDNDIQIDVEGQSGGSAGTVGETSGVAIASDASKTVVSGVSESGLASETDSAEKGKNSPWVFVASAAGVVVAAGLITVIALRVRKTGAGADPVGKE